MEHVTEAHTLSIRREDIDCERIWYTENISKSPLQGKAAKNHFLGAGAMMCIAWERYELSRSGLYLYVQRWAHFKMVSISRYK